MGSVVGSIDLTQVVLYVFWIFFAGLIVYLRREDKREGYPLESDRSGGRVVVNGYPNIPAPKSFRLPTGRVVYKPDFLSDTRELPAEPTAKWPGAPLEPVGDPMLAAVGPGSFAERADTPDTTYDGQPAIVPMRVEPSASVEPRDVDPRGMTVIAADRKAAGVVSEIWMHRGEPHVQYYEVALPSGKHVLLPEVFTKVDKAGKTVQVDAILASQFENVPGLRDPDSITKLEEEKITGYYGGGLLYATPRRSGDAI